MKRNCLLGFGLQFLLLFISLCLAKEEAYKANEQGVSSQYFHLSYSNIARLEMNILSESSVYSWLDCGTSCLETHFCVAYNYKEKSKVNEINCQLSATMDHQFYSERDEDNGWSFYEAIDGPAKIQQEKDDEDKDNQMSTFTPLSETTVKTTILPQHQDCFGYNWLNESTRNQKYIPTKAEATCDRNISLGWYRFGGGAGTKMPTQCVSKWRCGTRVSGWMNGSDPTVDDGNVTRRVCYHWKNSCCWRSNNIQVVNCGQFYVYKLGPPPHCDCRYCGSDN